MGQGQSSQEQPAAAASDEKVEEKPATSILSGMDPSQEKGIATGEQAAPSHPTSVFEFGAMVPNGGEFLKGMCAGDDPDIIQACVWSIHPVEGKPKEKKPMYKIEF